MVNIIISAMTAIAATYTYTGDDNRDKILFWTTTRKYNNNILSGYSLPSPSLHSILSFEWLYRIGHSAMWRLSEVAVGSGAYHPLTTTVAVLTVVTVAVAVVVVVVAVVVTMVVLFSPPSPSLRGTTAAFASVCRECTACKRGSSQIDKIGNIVICYSRDITIRGKIRNAIK